MQKFENRGPGSAKVWESGRRVLLRFLSFAGLMVSLGNTAEAGTFERPGGCSPLFRIAAVTRVVDDYIAERRRSNSRPTAGFDSRMLDDLTDRILDAIDRHYVRRDDLIGSRASRQAALANAVDILGLDAMVRCFPRFARYYASVSSEGETGRRTGPPSPPSHQSAASTIRRLGGPVVESSAPAARPSIANRDAVPVAPPSIPQPQFPSPPAAREAPDLRAAQEAEKAARIKAAREAINRAKSDPAQILRVAYHHYMIGTVCFEARSDLLVQFVTQKQLAEAREATKSLQERMIEKNPQLSPEAMWSSVADSFGDQQYFLQFDPNVIIVADVENPLASAFLDVARKQHATAFSGSAASERFVSFRRWLRTTAGDSEQRAICDGSILHAREALAKLDPSVGRPKKDF